MLEINSAEHHKAIYKLMNIIVSNLKSNAELKTANSFKHTALYVKIIIKILRQLKFRIGEYCCTSTLANGTCYILDNTNENVFIKLGVPNEIIFNFDELQITDESHALIKEYNIGN